MPITKIKQVEGLQDALDSTSASVLSTGDKNLPAVSVVEDETFSGVSISSTPVSGSALMVFLNGYLVPLGDGVKTSFCYFSADSGVTARNIADIEAGDELYWNASISGIALDSLDRFDLHYLVKVA